VSFYRKKPVVIEARQLTRGRQTATDLAAWCGGWISEEPDHEAPSIIIPTLEGDRLTQQGDWIIKGVVGEFYPVRPRVFEITYEPAGEVTS
jgi:hypothetical protein